MFSRKKRQAEGEGAEAKTHECRVVVGLPKDFVVSFILTSESLASCDSKPHGTIKTSLENLIGKLAMLGVKGENFNVALLFCGWKTLVLQLFSGSRTGKKRTKKDFWKLSLRLF